MADYIYMMETRLSPDQLRAVSAVQEAARQHGMNLYLTGGAMRDIVSGFTIRDLDFTVQGNALKLQKDLERAGATVRGSDEELKTLGLLFRGNVRGEVHMARSETYPKPGKPQIAPGTITDDLRRRDFTVNAMALSLNEGSRGLLLDPTNGAADVEAKVLRILHNYSFYEDPSRLIRATRFAARFHWPMEERTQARYDAAKENNYIENISDRARGYELELVAYEDDPLHVMRALEKEGWLKVLHPHWSSAKVDTSGLAALIKTEQRMRELGYSVDAAPARMYFLTDKLNDREIAELQKLIPHKEFVAAWRNLENEAKDLAKRLTGKEAATPSRTWELLSHARPESILFLETTGRQQAVLQKIRNFFGKWREMKQKLPLPEMVEMRITPELPEYPKIAEDVFRLMLDGKLRSHNELVKFLKPFSPPPPPPPPPPPRRGRAARVEAAAAGAAKGGAPAAKGGTPVAKAGTAAAVAPAATAAAKGVKKKAGAPVGQPVLTPAAVQPQVAGQKAGRAVKPGAAKPAATTAPPPPAAATTKALAKAAAKAAASAHASKATGKKPTPAKKPTKPAAKAKKRH